MKLSSCACLAMLLIGCGGGGDKPEVKTADDVHSEDGGETQRRGAPDVQAEIGGLDADKVDATFSKALGSIKKCLNQGAKRVEFLGGGVAFFVKIDLEGKAIHTHLERSTLGDRTTEKCMLDALRSRDWPKPVGGEVGLARKSYDFDMLNDVRPPTEWSSEEAGPGLDKINGKIAECKHGKGGFEATFYVDTEGNVLSAGATPPDEEGEESVDCIVEALKGGTFPSPGSWPAKVTLSL
jgi:hypothetical protein